MGGPRFKLGDLRDRVDFRRERLPIFVWLVAVGFAAYVLGSQVLSHEYVGLAQALRYEVSVASAGTVEEVLVEPLDRVSAGDVVARLDDQLIQARMQTASAAVHQLAAQLEAERAKVTAGGSLRAEGYTADLRRFQMDEEQLSLEALNIRVSLEADRVEAERLQLEANRAQRLLEAGLLSEIDRDAARFTHEQVRVRVNRNTELLARTEEQQRVAFRRREEFERSHPSVVGIGPALRPLAEAVKVQEATVEELRVQLRGLILRAPVTGEVSQVLCRQGQAVTAGEAVVLISEQVPTEVLAYLPGSTAARVRENSPVLISRRADPRRTAESYVTRVGSAIETTPQQLWRDPRSPEYGLPVAIAASPALMLTPGEVVFVRPLRTR